ncbi:hypothetical protein PSACC_00216 [Paramicrosporidium saccamoebae]|uniref:Uncharacterized protein n=1 Tax=Paramicrosporidium saccamoebae TaxID=1246581 RepID=A0A2H9TQM7_9FUNG|nr:hypothetical protein PSACC_00700 [Paramicrosporidium saccamoebae]PJF19970.1 hypothetical protein PSACC_00216 [Paramicrosporidium saccamoebae]
MMMHKAFLITATLLSAAVQAINVDPEMEDMPMPHADYPVEHNDKILALVGKLTRKQERKQRNIGQRHVSEQRNIGQRHVPEQRNIGQRHGSEQQDLGQRHVSEPKFRKVKIPSEEEGKRFLRKYCKRGKCTFPKKMRINNKRKAKKTKRRSKRNKINKRRLTASEIEGVLAVQKVADRTRGKIGRNDRHIKDEDNSIMHPWDNEKPRKIKARKGKKVRKASADKEEPIMHPWSGDEHKERVEEQIVVVRRKPGKDKKHPRFEVNQINLHVDVNVKQQQAQKEKQGIVQVGKINHKHGKHHKHHGRKNIKGRSAKRGIVLASVRQPTERVPLRHHQRPEKQKPEPGYDEPKSKRSFLKDLKRRVKRGCRKMKKKLGMMRDRFEEEPTINQLAMVLALAAIITMQAMVLSKFLGMFDGYTPVPHNNDDDDDMTEILEKGTARKTTSHTERMVQEKF